MRPINLCTLEIRIGKCHLNIKSDGLFAVSLQMGKHASQMSPKKSIQNGIVPFNTTLRMNIDNELLQEEANPKCRILLYLVRENRQKQVIGVTTIDINTENNQGFKYHEFGQCADCESDIEVSVNCSSSFQLGVKSEVGYLITSESRLYDGSYLEVQRGRDFQDSVLENSEMNQTKHSKTVSNIDWTSANRATRQKKPSINFKLRRSTNIKDFRKPKPQNFSSCAPQEIITHYETQIKTLQDELRSREEWASGMKQMIQQLEAQNQLLKEIKIEELQQNNIQNLQQGIDYVSKLVHSKFQASKSMIYDTQNEIFSDSRLGNTSRQRLDEQLRLELKGTINESNMQESERQIVGETPKIIISPRMTSPLKGERMGMGEVVESRQELENALKILTSQQKDQIISSSQQSIKITELQESLFQLRQQKQQLQDITQQLYEQLRTTKSERDSFYDQIQLLGKELEEITQTMEELKDQNEQLKDQCKRYEMSSNQEGIDSMQSDNKRLYDINFELERKLKESVKAIQEFKNDALSARSELIIKQDELNSYRMKFGELGSMTEVIMNQYKVKSDNQSRSQKRLFSFKDVTTKTSNQTYDSTITSSTSSLHSVYAQLLKTSIIQRKELQHSLSQIITQSQVADTISQSNSKANIKKVQLQINKLFIQIFKNNAQLKNIKQIETIKKELSIQIDTIISTF